MAASKLCKDIEKDLLSFVLCIHWYTCMRNSNNYWFSAGQLRHIEVRENQAEEKLSL